MATDIQIKQWRKELIRDYPQCDPYFLDLVLDIYKHNPDYIKKLHKKKFKEITTEVPKEIVGGMSVILADDTETISKYFKTPVALNEDYEEVKA
jgi:hypothetical protein